MPGPPIPIPIPTLKRHLAIADTGCTAHFFTIDALYHNARPAPKPISIQNPNGSIMTSNTIADIRLPNLPASFPPSALQIYVVPALQTKSLMSLGQLCDAGCSIKLTSTTLEVMYNDTCILQGTRTELSKLWHVDLSEAPEPPVVRVEPPALRIEHTAYLAAGGASPAHLVAFHHASLGAPTISTLEKALRLNYITGFPGLTVETLRKHPPTTSIPMLKGHMDQSRKNQRTTTHIGAEATIIPYTPSEVSTTRTHEDSTSVPMPRIHDANGTIPMSHIQDDTTTVSTSPIYDDDDQFPLSEATNERTHYCYAATHAASGTIYTDQTGKFIAPSSTGNNYLFVLYDYDSNCILCEPIKNRTKHSILAAFKVLHSQLIKAGIRPKLQRLDNECSDILKEFMVDQGIDYQLVPPHVHRRNAAERAIRTLKKHFIATLCATDPNFPLELWDRLLPQAVLSLNLMRGSRINPKLSAYAQLFGLFDYNRTPLAPPGTRAIIHDKPSNRDSWAAHGLDGWYLGPALESYRCYVCWITETRRERICDTVAFLPVHVTLPVATANDMILASLRDIVKALNSSAPNVPLVPPAITNTNRTALMQLQLLLDPPTDIDRVAGPAPLPEHNPPLSIRVPASQHVTDATSLRVEPLSQPTVEPRDTLANAPLRVKPTLQEYTPSTPKRSNLTPGPQAVTIEDDQLPAPPLPPIDAAVPPPLALPPPAASSPPETTAPATFQSKTGPKARKTRRAARRNHVSTRKSIPRHSHRTRQSTGVLPAHVAAQTALFPDEFALHGNAFNPDTGRLAEYKELSLSSDGVHWIESNCEEIGRLFQGYKDVAGTNTCFFIYKDEVPWDKLPTYLRIVAAHRPEKDNPMRIRWTAGGDRIYYAFDASTKTADLCTVKCMVNSVISRRNGRFMTLDLKDFFLGTPLVEFEYMRIARHTVPDVIMDLYQLWDKVAPDGYLYVRIERGMYGLPHAGRIANDALIAYLAPFGYAPCELTPGLWRHDTDDLAFTLVVDDFGVRYTQRAHVEKLLEVLRRKYELKADWTGSRYCGLTLEWDYANQTVDVSMPGYVERALQRFAHTHDPSVPSSSPHHYQAPMFGQKIQYATSNDASPVLDAKSKTRLQEIIGVFLYYARAVDNTMLPALGTIATKQATPTQHTMNAAIQLLNYAAANPNAILRYVASDMILHVESDASYLSESKARSRYAGYHYLSSQPSATPHSDPVPPFNAAVHVPCQILKEIVSSAAEAELAGLFHNAKEACPIRICLEELGHPQPATPIVTDNSTAVGIANDTIKQKRSKAIDMRFYWVRDRVHQKQFTILWRKGELNKADYFTKHHAAKHHRAMRSTYLHVPGTTKNYFECLSDDDDDTSTVPTDTYTTNDSTAGIPFKTDNLSKFSLPGEGVLKSVPGYPCQSFTAATALLTRDDHTDSCSPHNFE